MKDIEFIIERLKVAKNERLRLLQGEREKGKQDENKFSTLTNELNKIDDAIYYLNFIL